MESWPKSVRVICVGEEMSGVFCSIKSLGFEEVSVQSTTMFPNPTPTDEDKMVILLTNGESKLLESIAKSFYQAGVLTLMVTTKIVEMTETFCDSQTVEPIESMPFKVKALFNYLLKPQYLCLDFMDLCTILSKSSKFKVIEVSSVLKENCIREIVSKLSQNIGCYSIEQIERLSMGLYVNDRESLSLKFTELEALKDYVHELPNDIAVIWSIGFDNEMQNGEIRLDAILSGKNLKL